MGDIVVWLMAAIAAALVIAVAIDYLPARVRIVIDTPTSTARVEMRPFWGLLPTMFARSLPQTGVSQPLAVFNDVDRIGPALMTPGLSDAVYEAVSNLYALKPTDGRLHVGLNLADAAQNRVVQTAAEAAMAMAPPHLRERIEITACDAPGAEVSMHWAVIASPSHILAIRDRFKNSRAGREFRKRLKQKPKSVKRPVREVRTN